MMLVNIRYFKTASNGYAGNAFTYRTSIDLQVGDKVMAPTKGGDKRAMVVEVNVPESRVDERIMPLLKEITEYDTGEKEDADA